MNNYHILNQVFSERMINELYDNLSSPLLDKVYTRHFDKETTNLEKIKDIYKFLSKNYRNEYFYKNTIINKILLGRHSLSTTVALSEIKINKSKADLVLINGKGIVYEIKSELDSLKKLEKQVNDYYKVFDHVMIVTSEKHLNNVMKMYNHSSVGVALLTKRDTIKVIKKPEANRTMLSYEFLYKLLRKPERYSIIQSYYKEIPPYNQFEEYKKLYKLFCDIEIHEVYEKVIKELKSRNNFRDKQNEFKEIPYELRALFYFSSVIKKNSKELNTILQE